jgi:hypothetical protein
MSPVDGVWTLNQHELIEVLQQIKPKLIMPMHIFTSATLDKFLTRISSLYAVRRATDRTVLVSRSQLPETAEVLVIPGG